MNKRSGLDTKTKILDGAKRVFADYGYAKANMRLIARISGVSVGCLYLHFSDKKELYSTLMVARMEAMNRHLSEILDRKRDPMEALSAFITASINDALVNLDAILLQSREFGSGFGVEVKNEFFRSRRQLIEGILVRGRLSGVFDVVDPHETAKVIFSMIRGFVISLVSDEGALFQPEECVRLVLHGLLTRN